MKQFFGLFLGLIICAGTAAALEMAPFVTRNDTDFDGSIDTWAYFDKTGKLQATARDTNKDGEPDQFKQFLKGKSLILREFDRNFDAKIDMRKLSEWGVVRRESGGRAIPSYITLQREEDNDFDGIVDSYYDRYDRQSTLKIGQRI